MTARKPSSLPLLKDSSPDPRTQVFPHNTQLIGERLNGNPARISLRRTIQYGPHWKASSVARSLFSQHGAGLGFNSLAGSRSSDSLSPIRPCPN